MALYYLEHDLNPSGTENKNLGVLVTNSVFWTWQISSLLAKAYTSLYITEPNWMHFAYKIVMNV